MHYIYYKHYNVIYYIYYKYYINYILNMDSTYTITDPGITEALQET